jgi:hypothetical protein
MEWGGRRSTLGIPAVAEVLRRGFLGSEGTEPLSGIVESIMAGLSDFKEAHVDLKHSTTYSQLIGNKDLFSQ